MAKKTKQSDKQTKKSKEKLLQVSVEKFPKTELILQELSELLNDKENYRP